MLSCGGILSKEGFYLGAQKVKKSLKGRGVAPDFRFCEGLLVVLKRGWECFGD